MVKINKVERGSKREKEDEAKQNKRKKRVSSEDEIKRKKNFFVMSNKCMKKHTLESDDKSQTMF